MSSPNDGGWMTQMGKWNSSRSFKKLNFVMFVYKKQQPTTGNNDAFY